eukprot:scpid84674/ scgid0914/ 
MHHTCVCVHLHVYIFILLKQKILHGLLFQQLPGSNLTMPVCGALLRSVRPAHRQFRAGVGCCWRYAHHSTADPVAYLAKRALPPWCKVHVESNMNVIVLPNTYVTRFLVGASKPELEDGDQVMSVWLGKGSSKSPPAPVTFQALPDSAKDLVTFGLESSDDVSISCHVSESVLRELHGIVPSPTFVFHIPLKTSVDLLTGGHAVVHGIDCDDVTMRSSSGNCEVSGLKVSNQVSMVADCQSTDDAGSITILDTVQASSISAVATRRIECNRLLALDVSMSVDHKESNYSDQIGTSVSASLHAESIYAQKITLASSGSVRSAVLSADQCDVSAQHDVSIGKTTIKKPFSADTVVLDTSETVGGGSLVDHVAIHDDV